MNSRHSADDRARTQALRIGVFLGGNSPEREGSLISGRAAAEALAGAGHTVTLIDPAEDSLEGLGEQIDIGFMALHGLMGEDGKIQGLLEMRNIPYTGSGVLASALAMHKPRFKQFLAGAGIDTPSHETVDPDATAASEADRICRTLGTPAVLKPASGGGSLGAVIIRDSATLAGLLTGHTRAGYQEFFVEKFIAGKSLTAGLIDLDGKLTCLPPLEVETDREFYDYIAKHDAAARRYFCPARLAGSRLDRVQQIALDVHRMIGAHGFSRVDFMLARDGRPFVLEANTLPGLSPAGNLATMAQAANIGYPQLVQAILSTALSKPRYVP